MFTSFASIFKIFVVTNVLPFRLHKGSEARNMLCKNTTHCVQTISSFLVFDMPSCGHSLRGKHGWRVLNYVVTYCKTPEPDPMVVMLLFVQ